MHSEVIPPNIFYQLSILFSGGRDDAGDESDKTLMFNKEIRIFEENGKLEQRRRSHSMSVVNIIDYNCM